MLRDPAARLFGSEIVGRHHDPYTVAAQFEAPGPPGLYTQPATDYTGAVLAALAGDGIVAYNLLVLASFPLAALAAYLLARGLGGSRLAAWIAAFAYAFAPFHVAHAAYHPHVAQTQWLPLYLLALWRAVERPTSARLALAALAAAVLVMASFYNLPLAAVVSPIVVAGAALAVPRGRRLGAVTRVAATLGALAAAGAGYAALVAPQVLTHTRSLAFPRADLARYTARPASYLLPPVEHPLLGAWSSRIWSERGVDDALVEQQLTVGLGLALLALVACSWWWRGRRRAPAGAAGAPGVEVPTLAALGAVCFLFSLPPVWHLGGWSVPAPSAALYAVAPMFRAHARFGLGVLLAAAVLAGLAVERLRARGPGGTAIAAALLAVACLELTPLPPWRWREVLPTEAHRWLARQRPEVRGFDCSPVLDPGTRGLARLMRRPLGRNGRWDDCGDPGLAARLAGGGFDRVLVPRPSPFARWIDAGGPPAGLRVEHAWDDSLVLAVDAEPATVALRFGPGFSWREYGGERTYRWMGSRGTLFVDVAGAAPVTATLELELAAFPGPRRLEVAAQGDGGGTVTLEVTPRPTWHAVGPLALAPGPSPIHLRALEPVAVPDELLGNGDRRAITVSLWRWRAVPTPP